MKQGYGVRLEAYNAKILLDISRINLKWNGNHEIFDLDRFDKAVNCATASTSDRRFETRWRPTLAFVALLETNGRNALMLPQLSAPLYRLAPG
jgi:hypothetical protein